jgi:hypothetical protein
LEAAEKRLGTLTPLYLLVCKALADHATASKSFTQALDMVRSCYTLQCAPVQALVIRVLKKYMQLADLQAGVLFNDRVEATVNLFNRCKKIMEASSDCYAMLNQQLLDSISPVCILALILLPFKH